MLGYRYPIKYDSPYSPQIAGRVYVCKGVHEGGVNKGVRECHILPYRYGIGKSRDLLMHVPTVPDNQPRDHAIVHHVVVSDSESIEYTVAKRCTEQMLSQLLNVQLS